METSTTPHIIRPTARPYAWATPSGAQFIIPKGTATADLDGVPESTLGVLYPRILKGDVENGIAYNPLCELCEVRIEGKVEYQAVTRYECERAMPQVARLSALVAPVAKDCPAPPVTPKPKPRPAMTHRQKLEHGDAVGAFWGAVKRMGLQRKDKLETMEQRAARLACISSYLNLPEIESLNDLSAQQVESLTRAIYDQAIVGNWEIMLRRAA